MPTLFKRAEDTHQDSLSIRTTLAAVSVAVFANDDRRANSSLGVVVIDGTNVEEFGPGPLSTPLIVEPRIYAIGVTGIVTFSSS